MNRRSRVFVANIGRHGAIADMGRASSCCARNVVASIGTRGVRVKIGHPRSSSLRTLALPPPGLLSATGRHIA